MTDTQRMAYRCLVEGHSTDEGIWCYDCGDIVAASALVPDPRLTPREIAALQSENAALRKQIADLSVPSSVSSAIEEEATNG